MYPRRKQLIIVLIIVILIFNLWSLILGPGQELLNLYQGQTTSSYVSFAPALATYDIKSMDSQFQSLWTISDIFIIADGNWECNILAFHNKLFYQASYERTHPTSLHRADLLTGVIEWQSISAHEAPSVMTHNDTTVFIGSGPEIIAYDTESGDQIWRRGLPILEKSITYIQSTGDSVYANSGSTGNFYAYNARSGKRQDIGFRLNATPIFLVSNDTIYYQEAGTRLYAMHRQDKNIIWTLRFDEELQLSPLFTEELIIARTGRAVIGQVYVIDRTTGTTLWQYPAGAIDWENPANVVGNVAEDNGYIFYLTFDAQLQAVDAKTGQFVGAVQFNPSFQELDGLDLVNRVFCVAASDNVVIVYFGSGRQLFAFRFLPNEQNRN